MDFDKLISLVQEHLPLWDMRDKRYHRRDIQRTLWARVAKSLGAQVDDVKKKWRGLRDTFRKEYVKYNERRSGEDGANLSTPSWPYFNQMLFLEDVLAPGKVNVNDKSQQNSDLDSDAFLLTPEDSVSQFVKTENDGSVDSFSAICEQRFAMEDMAGGSGPSPYPTRSPSIQATRSTKRKRNPDEETLIDVERRRFESLSESATLKNNSDYQFLVSLLPFMMRVPHRRKLAVRCKIQQVLIDEENTEETQDPLFSSPNHVTSTPQMD